MCGPVAGLVQPSFRHSEGGPQDCCYNICSVAAAHVRGCRRRLRGRWRHCRDCGLTRGSCGARGLARARDER